MGVFFLVHVDQITIQGHQKKGAKPAFGLIGSLNQTASKYDFVQKTLCQILGLLSRPEELEEMAAAARDIAVPDAADRIAELLESVAR